MVFPEESGFLSAQAGGTCYWVEDCTQPGYSCSKTYQECVDSGPWICVENCLQPQGCSCPSGFCESYESVPCGSGGLVSYESCICEDCTKKCGGPLQPPCPRCGKPGLPDCPKNPPGPCQGRAAFPNQGPPPAAAEGAANLKRELTCNNIIAMYAHGMAARAKKKKEECPNGKIKQKGTGNFYASCGNCFEDVEIVCCAKEKCKTLAEAKTENPCDDVTYQVKNGKRVLDECGCPQFDFNPKNNNINCLNCSLPAENTGCQPDGNNKWKWIPPFCVPRRRIRCQPCDKYSGVCINNVWVEGCDPKTLQGEAAFLGIACPPVGGDPYCWDLVGGCSPDRTVWTPPKCVNTCSSSSSSSDSSSSSGSSSSSNTFPPECQTANDCPVCKSGDTLANNDRCCPPGYTYPRSTGVDCCTDSTETDCVWSVDFADPHCCDGQCQEGPCNRSSSSSSSSSVVSSSSSSSSCEVCGSGCPCPAGQTCHYGKCRSPNDFGTCCPIGPLADGELPDGTDFSTCMNYFNGNLGHAKFVDFGQPC